MGVLKKNGIQYGNGGGGGSANVDELTAAQIQDIKDAFENAMPSGPFAYEVAESLTHDQMEDIKSYIDGITPSPFPSMQYKYSTSEVVVGEWIDGSKIYQKTYEVIGAGGSNQIVDSSFPGTKLIDMKCTDMEGSSLNGATYAGIPSANTLTMFILPTSWVFASGRTYYLTVQYIK